MKLTQDQVRTLKILVENHTIDGNYGKAYIYIRDLLGEAYKNDGSSKASFYKNSLYNRYTWFWVAAQTNSQDGGLVDTELRAVSQGLANQNGKSFSDLIYNKASNDLAAVLFERIITFGEIPSIEWIVKADADNFAQGFGLKSWQWPGTMGDSLVLGGDWVSIPDSVSNSDIVSNLAILATYGAAYGWDALVGQASAVFTKSKYYNSSNIADMAKKEGKEGIAARLALKYLLPLTTVQNDNSAYESINRNGELDIYDNNSEKGSISLEYIAQRAKLLSLITSTKPSQTSTLPIPGKEDIYAPSADGKFYLFEERNSKFTAALIPADGSIPEPYQIIFGNESNESLTGGSKNDSLFAMDGNDTLDGGAGADYLEGGKGLDVLKGGEGNDTLFGMADNDTLDGGADEDSLDGGAGADSLTGGLARDTLRGGSGDDQLYGEEGNDALYGGADKDQLNGGAGNDWLEGGDGFDTYFVEKDQGNDVLLDSDGVGGIVFCGTALTGGQSKNGGSVFTDVNDSQITYTLTSPSNG
ncbi:calcium-binding protein, partial [Parachitinimonas caeni]